MFKDCDNNPINIGDHVKIIRENLSNFNKEFIVEDIGYVSGGRGSTVGSIVCSDGQQFIRFSEKSLKIIGSNRKKDEQKETNIMITDYYDNLINVGDKVKIVNFTLSTYGKTFDVKYFDDCYVVCTDKEYSLPFNFNGKSLKIISSEINSQQKIGLFFHKTTDAESFKENGIMNDSDDLNVPVISYSAKNCVERFNQLNIEEKEDYEALYFDGEVYELKVAVNLNLVNQNN